MTPPLPEALTTLRTAQTAWAATPLAQRLAVLARAQTAIARHPQPFLAALAALGRKTGAEALSAEVLPLLASLKHTVKSAPCILKPRTLSRCHRPLWLWGQKVVVHREPHGAVLILAPFNYPLYLPGSQLIQALAAGNAVAVKPAPGCAQVLHHLAAVLHNAGLPEGLLEILPDDQTTGAAATQAGFDYCLLTGGVVTGRAVLKNLAETITPACVELSGHDALFVLPGANLLHVAQALRFGLLLNGGATCIAPRRVFAPQASLTQLKLHLGQLSGWVWQGAAPLPPMPPELLTRIQSAAGQGAATGTEILTLGAATLVFNPPENAELLTHDHFAPVACVVGYENIDDALALARTCSFRLGAAVFGPQKEARALALRVPAQVVTLNDLIVPTADPRVPFGGSGQAGFGVTRGEEGLKSLTRLRTVITPQRFKPHFSGSTPPLKPLLWLLRLLYG